MSLNVFCFLATLDDLDTLCRDLASAIVENRASKLKVCALVYDTLSNGRPGLKLVRELQKLTVTFVRSLREEALEKLEDAQFHDQEYDLEGTVTYDSLCKILRQRQLGAPHVKGRVDAADVILFYRNGEARRFLGDPANPDLADAVQAGGAPPRCKHVKSVRAFDGNFTIGDPEEPLLSVPVRLYPITRHTAPIETANYVGGRRIVQSATLKTESGAPVQPEAIEKAYSYLNELVTADSGVQALMNGEFQGAERWPKAFELLATVPKIPPWLPYERTDCVIGSTPAANEFIRALSVVLEESGMDALARLCRDPRRGEDGLPKHKGKLELVALYPASHQRLFCSPLPFREDYKYYYRFSELAPEPEEDEKELDEKMDAIVDLMTVPTPPEPQRNALVERVSFYVREKIAVGQAEVPPVPSSAATEIPAELKDRTLQLKTEFGAIERIAAASKPDAEADEADWDFEFV